MFNGNNSIGYKMSKFCGSLFIVIYLAGCVHLSRTAPSESGVSRGTASATAPVRPAACEAPAPLTMSQMDPFQLASYIQENRATLRDIGGVICCLPEIYRKNYLVGHGSMAGQPGSPESPRIILHPHINEGRADEILHDPRGEALIVTVNGGAPNLQQNMSVEMAYYNRAAARPLNYFDLDMSDPKSAWRAEKNPQTCMFCHGDQGQVPAEGARPIFGTFPHWTHFVGGAKSCNPAEDAMQTALQKVALKSLQTNPRFRCLDQTGIDSDLEKDVIRHGESARSVSVGDADLGGHDLFVRLVNAERVARLVRNTPDFAAYKFLILGVAKCQPDDLRAWMPEKVIRRHRNNSFIQPAVLARLQSPAATGWVDRLKAEARDKRRSEIEDLKNTKSFLTGGFDPSENPFVCDNDRNAAIVEKFPGSTDKSGNPFLLAYDSDNRARRPALADHPSTDPWYRFIFEGRGIDMNSWGAEIFPSDSMLFPWEDDYLFQAEDPRSLIGKILEISRTTFDPKTEQSSAAALREPCAELARTSYRALDALPR